MVSEISITVEAVFEPDGQLYPVAFTLNGRRQRISQHGRRWTGASGERHFLVMTGPTAIYELVFTPATLQWQLLPKTGGWLLV